MNNYIVHTAIKCSDGKVHRLSYDMCSQTEESMWEFSRVFKEIEDRFPDVQFWIDQYPDKSTDKFIRIYGNSIQESLKVPNAVRQIDEIVSPNDLGIEYTVNKD